MCRVLQQLTPMGPEAEIPATGHPRHAAIHPKHDTGTGGAHTSGAFRETANWRTVTKTMTRGNGNHGIGMDAGRASRKAVVWTSNSKYYALPRSQWAEQESIAQAFNHKASEAPLTHTGMCRM